MAERAVIGRSSGWVRQSARSSVWWRLARQRSAVLGGSIIIALVLVALVGPLVVPYDPLAMELGNRLRPPSLAHPFGTDEFGRDVLSRVLFGARISLHVGIIAVGIAGTLGCLLGLVTGYFGGWLDAAGQWLVDVLLAFPGLLLALAITAILGPGLPNVMVAVGISALPAYARVTRGQVLALKREEFVTAARVVGCSSARILFRHLLPNMLAPIVVLASLGFAGAVLAAASLSFIGMGAQPPTPEWGAMLAAGRDYLRRQWWIATFPGLAIALTVLGFNLLGDGLRDALDPYHPVTRTQRGDRLSR
ncbi:MAG: ABC transporter permease [Thermomicrobium sp.]|nr:ABC transporter permease [Thermomicrobium sp.]